MKRSATLLFGVAVVLAVAARFGHVSAAADPAAIDRAFQDFWSAPDADTAAKRADAVVKSGVSFDDALARLRRGRVYAAAVPHGTQRGHHRTFDGVDHPYAFTIPENYSPAKTYQVRVQLHGGIGRTEPPDDNRLGIARIPGTVEEIGVFPAGWGDSMWWETAQVDNLSKILDTLKRTYNIDENRTYLTGISDGGTGTYFMAFRNATPWAAFLPLIGAMTVLANPDVGADGEMFPGNAVNKPFFIVNAGRDRLYPARTVQPFVEHLRALGTELVFHVKPKSDHNTNWWPEERAGYEAFVAGHPRNPLPDRLSWETERTDRYNRIDWLVIDRLGQAPGQTKLPDSNLMRRDTGYDSFKAGLVDQPPLPIFPRGQPSGRVDLTRRGNVVEASTQGVNSFTLLLSPAQFDFAQPVRVVANGRTVFDGRVVPSVATLLKWAARDDDRTMLFGAELTVELAEK